MGDCETDAEASASFHLALQDVYYHGMTTPMSRDDLASQYLDLLPYDPYPVQEEALLAWFGSDRGVLVCAPTGTGKTLVAEAAMFEALHTRQVAYYTTPLIALTEQKFREMQAAAVRWGFHPDDVGLVTGNRRVNPDAVVRVVVAEILLNRLLHREEFDFDDTAAVVMDEFHSFNDPERGVVWELSLGLLPEHVRLMLLSATVGNTAEFLMWLSRSHNRKLQLVQSRDRKVPLEYEWVPDQLLTEQLEVMAEGDEHARRTPALVFCFNREGCWSVAEQLKGKSLLAEGQRKQLLEELEHRNLSQGAGPKLKQILLRGVGVHHAGLLPRNRRIVEELFQRKLLSVCVCTETLAAGINLPARSVLLTSLIKGPPGKKKLIFPSGAHQMFGRAGRPQFDDRGYVFALPHEDDVKILRFKEKYDQIPEDTKDPHLIKAKKKLKKKAPKRRETEQYWSVEQFNKLIAAPPGDLASKGQMPWRLLAYLLKISPEVERLREFVRKRLLPERQREGAQKNLTHMLRTLWAGGYISLEPEPPPPGEPVTAAADQPQQQEKQPAVGTFGALLAEARQESRQSAKRSKADDADEPEQREVWQPEFARPTPQLDRLLVFRSVNPLYGAFLIEHLGVADERERLQALESVLELPTSLGPPIRVPRYEELPPGPLATGALDIELVQRGVLSSDELYPSHDDLKPWEERRFAPRLAEKLRLLFDHELPGVHSLRTNAVWVAGELLRFGGDFNKYVTSKNLTKQEGMVFRHLLRFILLCEEFAQIAPPEYSLDDWQRELHALTDRVADACRTVDPDSTDKAIAAAQNTADVVAGETRAPTAQPGGDEEEFAAGLPD